MRKRRLFISCLAICATFIICVMSYSSGKTLISQSGCKTVCFRSPQYWLLNLSPLPRGSGIVIGGANLNTPTRNLTAIKKALQGGSAFGFPIGSSTPLQHLNRQYAAAQLNLIQAGGHSSPAAFSALNSPLRCHGLFVALKLANGVTITSGSKLGDLFAEARLAIRDNRPGDMLTLARLFERLNGDNPLGRCGGVIAGPPIGLMIDDVSPTTDSYPIENDGQRSVSGRVMSLAVSADGKRLYAGAFSGVWRSDDGGLTWHQLTRPQPPPDTNFVADALMAPTVFSVVVSPADKDIVLAAANRDTRVVPMNGIYRSTNGGDSWSLAHQFKCPGTVGDGLAGQIVFAPDDSNLAYAAGGCAIAISRDAGKTWEVKPMPAGGTVWHVAAAPQEGLIRRVYAVGDKQIWYSQDGGESWFKDMGPVPPADFGDFPDDGRSNTEQVLAVEPGRPDRVYLAVPSLANGPSYYQPLALGPDGITCNTGSRSGPNGCGEGSLWLADYSTFFPGQSASWIQLPGPPTYVGRSTDSGNVYVVTKRTPSGYLLFFSDRSHVHVSDGRPTTNASWHRLDGRNASQGRCEGCFGNPSDCNNLFVHVDPHAMAVSSDFNITLTPAFCTVGPARVPVPPPYDKNSVRDSFLGGTIWMGNDGGIYRSVNGGVTWTLGGGFATLQPEASFAGVALPGKPPALYFGVWDNDDFFSLDGGAKWDNNNVINCGDCRPWFSDPAQPNRVLEFDRHPRWVLYNNPDKNAYPDPGNNSHFGFVHLPPDSNVSVGGKDIPPSIVFKGYRPIVLTLSGEDPPGDGDYILIRFKPSGGRAVLRTFKIGSITSPADWDTTATDDDPKSPKEKAFQQGPDFLHPEMVNVDVVQASGGHTNTVFYAGDPEGTKGLWRWTRGVSA
ncbi:MAG: hypothetical protein ACREEM_11400, partial [Blastocatellia bacterium]